MLSLFHAGTGTVRNVANTKLRSFRISDEIYDAVKEKAEAEELTFTAVLLEALIAYLDA